MAFAADREELRCRRESPARFGSRPFAHRLMHPARNPAGGPGDRLDRRFDLVVADVQADYSPDIPEIEGPERPMTIAPFVCPLDQRSELGGRCRIPENP